MKTLFYLVCLAFAGVVTASQWFDHYQPLVQPIATLPGLNQSLPFEMYAGYIPIGQKSYFYFFVTSQSNSSATDPVVLWLNGGPGCSSIGGGLLSENGPIHPDENMNLYINPYSWNQIANVLYLESPAGVGYSLNPGDETFNDNKTAADNYQFLLQWFEVFPQYANNEFWVAGESYGGIYVPMLGEQIAKNSGNSANATRLANNFQGIMVGNPYVNNDDNSVVLYSKYHGLTDLNGNGGYGPGQYDPYDILVDYDPCSAIMLSEYVRFSVHPSIRRMLDNVKRAASNDEARTKRYVPNADPCINAYVSKYMNEQSVKDALGVTTTKKWALCGGPPYNEGDFSTVPIYKELVATYGKSVLVYSGDADTVCNFIGTEHWTTTLGFTPENQWSSWVYKRPDLPANQNAPQIGGFGINYKEGFTYITIKGAGHMVPWFEPAPAYKFFETFLTNKKMTF